MRNGAHGGLRCRLLLSHGAHAFLHRWPVWCFLIGDVPRLSETMILGGGDKGRSGAAGVRATPSKASDATDAGRSTPPARLNDCACTARACIQSTVSRREAWPVAGRSRLVGARWLPGMSREHADVEKQNRILSRSKHFVLKARSAAVQSTAARAPARPHPPSHSDEAGRGRR